MKVSVHEIEYEINISVIFSPDNILQTNDVLMARELLEEDDLSECTLGICCILKSIKVLLQRYDILGLLIDCLPDNTVSTLPYIYMLETHLA